MEIYDWTFWLPPLVTHLLFLIGAVILFVKVRDFSTLFMLVGWVLYFAANLDWHYNIVFNLLTDTSIKGLYATHPLSDLFKALTVMSAPGFFLASLGFLLFVLKVKGSGAKNAPNKSFKQPEAAGTPDGAP